MKRPSSVPKPLSTTPCRLWVPWGRKEVCRQWAGCSGPLPSSAPVLEARLSDLRLFWTTYPGLLKIGLFSVRPIG